MVLLPSPRVPVSSQVGEVLEVSEPEIFRVDVVVVSSR